MQDKVKKDVLMISSEPNFQDFAPSLSIFARDWKRSIENGGHSVTLVSFQKIFFIRALNMDRSVKDFLFNLKKFSLFPNWTIMSGAMFLLRSCLWLLKNPKQFNVVVCHNFFWAGLIGVLFFKCRSRIIVVEHNIKKMLERPSKLHQAIFKHFCNRYQFEIFCVSRKNAESYRANFGIECKFVPNPIDPIFCQQLPEVHSKNRIISIGSLDQNKDQKFQLKLLRSLPEQFMLTIVGTGPDFEKLKILVSKWDLQHRVSLVGYKSRTEILELLDTHNILINTSYSETFGVVNMEAGSRGLSVVSFDNGGVWDSTLNVGRNIIGDKNDLDIWVNTIRDCDQNFETRLKIAQKYQAFFSADEFMKKLGIT